MKRLTVFILLIFALPVFGQYDVFGQFTNPFSIYGSKTKKPSISFDTEAQALITRMQTTGAALSLGRQALINNVFKMLKDSLSITSLTQAFDALYSLDNYINPIDTNIVKLNWVQNAYNLTSYGQLTYDSSGVVGGANKYFSTGYNPKNNGVNYTLNSASVGVCSKTNNANTSYEMGGRDNSNNWGLLSLYIGGRSYLNINQTGDVSSVTTNTIGLFIGSRSSSNNIDITVNGVARTDENQVSSTALPDITFYLLGVNSKGSLLTTDKKLAHAFIGRAFSDIECRKIFNIFCYWESNKNANP